MSAADARAVEWDGDADCETCWLRDATEHGAAVLGRVDSEGDAWNWELAISRDAESEIVTIATGREVTRSIAKERVEAAGAAIANAIDAAIRGAA